MHRGLPAPPQQRGLWIGLAAAAVVVAGGAIYWAVTKPKQTQEVMQYAPDSQPWQWADEEMDKWQQIWSNSGQNVLPLQAGPNGWPELPPLTGRDIRGPSEPSLGALR